MPFDPEKKTIVVLGSGWGTTSLLSTLDTTDYNVVRLSSFSGAVMRDHRAVLSVAAVVTGVQF